MTGSETIFGCELHRLPPAYSSQPGEFYRVVQLGKSIHLRTGDRGTPGEVHIEMFSSVKAAEQEARTRVAAKRKMTRFELVCSMRIPVTRVVDTAIPLDPEQAFLDYWHAGILGDHKRAMPRGPMWVVVSGALREEHKDRAADAVLATLRSGPHVIDTVTDRVIGQLPRLPYLTPTAGGAFPQTLDTQARSLGVSWIADVDPSCVHGPISCAPCARFMADLLEFFCRDVQIRSLNRPDRQLLADTASRLMRAHSASTPT